MSTTWQTVHVRVNDKSTGKPTAVRLRITGRDGHYFAPLGRLSNFATEPGVDVGGNVLVDGKPHCFIDGTCEVRLPPGPLHIEISKGPEYQPVDTDISLAPGKLALRFEIERWLNLRDQGWFAGDTWCHFHTPHAALLEAMAEDLAVVNLLALETSLCNDNSGHLSLSNILAFSGQQPVLSAPGHLVVVNTLNEHPHLGRLLLLNCHRPVYPLSFGGKDRPDDWTLAAWCDQCHRKGGLVIGANYLRTQDSSLPGEVLADLLLGKVDALFCDAVAQRSTSESLAELGEWFRLLDCGLQMPLVAGSGKRDNRQVLGSQRTYARLVPGQEFTYGSWIEAVRLGRTFVTNGPMLFFRVDGQDPGAVIINPAGAATFQALVEAQGLSPISRLEIIANGQVVAFWDFDDSSKEIVLDHLLSLPRGGWIVARCWGRNDDHSTFAVTSPIYVRVAGQSPPIDATDVSKLSARLDRMLLWAENDACCDHAQDRQRFIGIFQEARKVLLRMVPQD